MIFRRKRRDRRKEIGTTFLHPAFALGTMNRGDFWNQRRPLILHCGSPDKPAYARLRCLHDDYDYTSAMFFSTQWEGRVLIGVNFATDYGDKHPNLDKVQGATIQAEDLRLRLELEGDLSSLELPQHWDQNEPARVRVADLLIRMKVNFAGFGNFEIHCESGRAKDTAWIDVVIYHGRRRPIDFGELDVAAIGIALNISDGRDEKHHWSEPQANIEDDRLVQSWEIHDKKLLLSIPVEPDEMGRLQKQPISLIDGRNISSD